MAPVCGLAEGTFKRHRFPVLLVAAAATSIHWCICDAALGKSAWSSFQGPLRGGGARSLGRVRCSAEADKPKGKAFYNYLTNQWDYALEGTPMPWEEARISFSDFFPWSEADNKALAILQEKVPQWRQGFLMPSDEAGVRRRFRILAEAAGGEAEGLAALTRNVGIMCVGERVTRAAAEALVTELGAQAAADVVRKNPGVLGIRASSLQGDGLQRTIAFANVLDFFLGPGKIFVSAFQLFAVAAGAKIIYDVIFLPNGLIRALPQ